MPTSLDQHLWDELCAALAAQGLPVPVDAGPSPAAAVVSPSWASVSAWADSGLMWLTGFPQAPPTLPDGPVLGRAEAAARLFTALSARLGRTVRPDVAVLLGGRAALLGLTRGGTRSAGGSCRLLPAADGWLAVNLARPHDEDAVVALLGALGALDDPAIPVSSTDPAVRTGSDASEVGARTWSPLGAAVATRPTREVVELARLLAMPVAALEVSRRPAPIRSLPRRLARTPGGSHPPPGPVDRAGGGPIGGRVVVDLSSMWAGPLCAHLLGRMGLRVIKVESVRRLDGARRGNADFYDWMHAGHESVVLDFATPDGRATLRRLLAHADVVLESSRPRALAHLGIDPDALLAARPGQVWASITAHGRTGAASDSAPDPVAFGDDAAVAGGLVAWHTHTHTPSPTPVFCADAIADPLTGLFAAVAVAAALRCGGGQLLDIAMRDVAAWTAAPLPRIPPAPTATADPAHIAPPVGAMAAAVRMTGSDQHGWTAHLDGHSRPVAPPAPPWPAGDTPPWPQAAEPGAHTRTVLADLPPA
ncbi:CoA transferase [Frankia sp. AgPm24]|uniref:CoA transferase n=1 Tax=Frankia sp. AgPm24 TaxID=631128 RepID=UPI00200D0266|nr:CoA transferase [Frankia sp. AgPm24]MCK9923086.1 CoA transferase [Frankia sp. AgPm24]